MDLDQLLALVRGGDVQARDALLQQLRPFVRAFFLRRRVGKAFVYSAAQTRQQTQAAILSKLVDAVGSHDDAAELLDALEQMVRERKMRLEKEDGGR